jgi:hypothetical protein
MFRHKKIEERHAQKSPAGFCATGAVYRYSHLNDRGFEMRFSYGSRRRWGDDSTTGRLGNGYRPSRAAALRDKHTSFYWQALGLTIVFVVAAVMLGAAHGTERLSATEDRPSVTPIVEFSGSFATGEAEREVSHANAL